MAELFSEIKWIGEFFIPNQYEKRFAGEIHYSPENGVILSYTINEADIPASSEVVHGILATGDRCTLLGRFAPKEYSGRTFKYGLSTRRGRVGFMYLLIGDFVMNNDLFFEFDFSLTNMQEFFFPKGFKDLVKYSQQPLITLRTSYGGIEVGNNATFGLIPKDITTQIHSGNKEALKELKDSFETIDAKYPDALFMLKKDISYRIRLKTDAGTAISTAYDHISDIANLFAVLIYSPVYPESIHVVKKGTDNSLYTFELYPSMSINKSTIELCTKDRSHFHMPITNSNTDLSSILDIWLDNPRAYSTIISSIQNETGFRDEHSLYGEIVLYATQFEFISHDAGVENSKKYQYPLDEFACEKIRNGLVNVFSKVKETDMGNGIGDLRNEIAHVGKPKKLLHMLSLPDLIDISICLQMTILGYILNGLSLSKKVIGDYQIKFTPDF